MSVIFNAYEDVRDIFPDPVSVTWVKGADIDRVVHEFGGDSVEVSEMTWSVDNEVLESVGGIFLITSEGGWTVIIEPASCRGADSGLLADLSEYGEALNLFWTVNHLAYLSYAAEGREVASFEPLAPESIGDSPDAVAWLRGLSVTTEQWQKDWKAAAFAVGEEVSGIRLDRAWLERQRWKVVTRQGEPVEDDSEEDGQVVLGPFSQGDHGLFLREDMLGFLAGDFTVACIAADPVPGNLRRIVLITSQEALRKAGIADPRVDEALMAIADGNGKRGKRGQRIQQFRDEFDSMATRYREKAQEVAGQEGTSLSLTRDTKAGRLMIGYHAVRTLAAALNPDVERAVQDVLTEARVLSPVFPNEEYPLMMETFDAIQRFIRTGETGL
ncbi:DUF6461 domain-containing protein [Streptosporangium sp. NPDC006930]|uniref:DUF6461 domain-containing protein n=1 Tax=unclassified Streptosporangium TaxID=2632669 RepID=UPI00342F574E